MAARLVLLLAVISMTAGCFTNPDIKEVVRTLEWELYPATLDPVAKVKLGPGSLGLAKAICGVVPDCREEALDFMRGVDEVHLGFFEVEGQVYDDPIELMSPDLREDLEADGWTVVVTVSGYQESVWVMARADKYEVTGIYVVALEREELVVVRLEGDLSRTLEAAVRRDDDFLVTANNIGDDW